MVTRDDLDNDCDGMSDEGCTCATGQSKRVCWSDHANVDTSIDCLDCAGGNPVEAISQRRASCSNAYSDSMALDLAEGKLRPRAALQSRRVSKRCSTSSTPNAFSVKFRPRLDLWSGRRHTGVPAGRMARRWIDAQYVRLPRNE